MPAGGKNLETPLPQPQVIHLERNQLKARTFLMGNEGGFVLLLPVELNSSQRNLLSSKWFGASEFGRRYIEAVSVSLVHAGKRIALCRTNQVAFDQHLHEAIRTFEVDGVVVRQRFFVPNHRSAVVVTLECDRPAQFVIEPQFDMRYYQTFSEDFSGYRASVVDDPRGSSELKVSNRIEGPRKEIGELRFYCSVRSTGSPLDIELIPPNERLCERTYLKDERREKLIHKAYSETHDRSPDEAPIWDSYSNTVYAPAIITASAPVTLVFACDEDETAAESEGREVAAQIPDLYRRKDEASLDLVEQGMLRTGSAEIDLAYVHVLTRFNAALVARDVNVRTSGHQIEHWTAIFAGDKYFLDAWKRDENISLEALLHTNAFETARAILDNTWQQQDPRTGRLPQIIQLGQPLVYFCSDGTPWALRRLMQYTRLSGDTTLLEEKYPMVERFFCASLDFVQRGLLPSGAIVDRNFLWETWEDTPYTPRDGFPVEIELLWLTALADFIPVVNAHNPQLARKLEETLQIGRASFELFYLDGYLADSIDYNWKPRELLTPNGFVAFDLGYPLPAELARDMVKLGREQLAGSVGVKSLAPRDWFKVLSHDFLSDPHNVHNGNMASVGIYNYHRGIEWLWLNQFMVEGELQCGSTDIGFHSYVAGQVRSALHKSGVAGLDELNDLHGPLGADFQAWSMSSFIACLHNFAGITVDAQSRAVKVRPSVPSAWPELVCRSRVGSTHFDLRATNRRDGSQRVVVEPLDDIPPDYCLEVGVRLPDSYPTMSATVNGKTVSAADLDLRRTWPDQKPTEAWITLPWTEAVTVEFEGGG